MNRRVYLASAFNNGVGGGLSQDFKDAVFTYPDLMESYHYFSAPGKLRKACNAHASGPKKVFLDSGAFSAWSKGAEIDVKEFGLFVIAHQDCIDVASVLDGIGDPVKTQENQKRLEDMGAEVLPCFHYGEPESYLEHYIENYEYITLGGMVPISTPQLHLWLDRIWGQYLTGPDGMPRLRVHGFGLTTMELVLKYPWYSVDSSSWVTASGFGTIMLYLGPGKTSALSISGESPNTKGINRHFDTLSPVERGAITRLVEEAGFHVEQLRNDYLARRMWNIEFYKKLAAEPVHPFFNRQPGLFD